MAPMFPCRGTWGQSGCYYWAVICLEGCCDILRKWLFLFDQCSVHATAWGMEMQSRAVNPLDWLLQRRIWGIRADNWHIPIAQWAWKNKLFPPLSISLSLWLHKAINLLIISAVAKSTRCCKQFDFPLCVCVWMKDSTCSSTFSLIRRCRIEQVTFICKYYPNETPINIYMSTPCNVQRRNDRQLL